VSAKNGSDLRKFVPKQIKRSAFTVTVSNFSRDSLAKHYGLSPEDILVTHIPPEEHSLHNEKTLKELLAAQDIAKPYILFVGTIEPRKNIPGLIDAYAALPQATRDKYDLVIVGRIGWNCDKEVERLASAKEQGLGVRHVGYVDEPTKAALFQGASLFAHASEYEGFGMPVLEAMSYDLPCAISDIPVFKEVAGNAAAYFDCHNPMDIAQNMEGILTDPARLKQLSDLSKRQAKSFSWDKVAAELYDKIAASAGKS
jgi:glycosyltransferase involved in cell wall biosynthesis